MFTAHGKHTHSHAHKHRWIKWVTHISTDLYSVTKLPTHTLYNGHSSLTQWNLNALNKKIKKHTHPHTQPPHAPPLTTHSTTKSFGNPEGAISKSAKEKRMIILLRVNLGAFCDYGYLFGAAQYSQHHNERKYRSLLGYENTCRPQIIPRSPSPQHLFTCSVSTRSAHLSHHCSLFKVLLFLSFFFLAQLVEEKGNFFRLSINIVLCGAEEYYLLVYHLLAPKIYLNIWLYRDISGLLSRLDSLLKH